MLTSKYHAIYTTPRISKVNMTILVEHLSSLYTNHHFIWRDDCRVSFFLSSKYNYQFIKSNYHLYNDISYSILIHYNAAWWCFIQRIWLWHGGLCWGIGFARSNREGGWLLLSFSFSCCSCGTRSECKMSQVLPLECLMEGFDWMAPNLAVLSTHTCSSRKLRRFT